MLLKFMRKKDIEGIPHTLTMSEYNKLQAEHILKHKWYLSEKLKREASMEEVMSDWENNGWADMFRKTFKVTKEDGTVISDRQRPAL